MGFRQGCGGQQLGPEKAPQKEDEEEGDGGVCRAGGEVRTGTCVDGSVGRAAWLERGLFEEAR